MRTPLERLADARAHASYAVGNAGGLDAETLAGSQQPLHAALYNLVVVGEALGRVPEEWRSLAPGIPWAAVTSLRNRIVHAYWQVDLTLVSGVIESRLGPLIEAIDDLAAAAGRAET